MLLRFFTPAGQFRVTVDPENDFPSVIPELAEKLPKDVDISSLTVSPERSGPNRDPRKLTDLKGITFTQVGVKYVPL